jgi:hypothetical protein
MSNQTTEIVSTMIGAKEVDHPGSRRPIALRQVTTRLLVFAAAVILTTATMSQMRMGLDGGALDANLGVNSGGFNRPIQAGSFSAPSFSNARYAPGMTRSMYGFQSTGTPIYNPQIASSFVMQRYSPVGYSGWSGVPSFVSPGWQYQYRYAWR